MKLGRINHLNRSLPEGLTCGALSDSQPVVEHIQSLVILPAFLVVILLFPSNQSSAHLQKMSNEELREIEAQGILDLVIRDGNTTFSGSYSVGCGILPPELEPCNSGTVTIDNTGKTFVRIETDMQLQINANMESAKLGYYDDRTDKYTDGVASDITSEDDEGTGWDFNLNTLGFGYNSNSGDGDPNSDVEMTNPYVELAFRDYNSGVSSREFLGLRVGAENVNGNVYLDANQISGSIRANLIDIFELWEDRDSSIVTNLAGGLGFSDTGDFWISFNKEPNFWGDYSLYKTNNCYQSQADCAFTDLDGEGFWFHAKENVAGSL